MFIQLPHYPSFIYSHTLSHQGLYCIFLLINSKHYKKFDWYAQWYPVMPVCDLDKRVPHAKTVMGLDLVVWWDRNESEWKVFDDSCPHRLAPLSEGRIDQWGRLQCVYHGWCFNGSGNCKFIPQAPPDGPPVTSP
jgi:phenylpropionate dioxygenase-like ring-hydroxylating dioxygenase large terminal subunit